MNQYWLPCFVLYLLSMLLYDIYTKEIQRLKENDVKVWDG